MMVYNVVQAHCTPVFLIFNFSGVDKRNFYFGRCQFLIAGAERDRSPSRPYKFYVVWTPLISYFVIALGKQ